MSEHTFQAMYSLSGNALWVVNPDGTVTLGEEFKEAFAATFAQMEADYHNLSERGNPECWRAAAQAAVEAFVREHREVGS